jgi:transposase
VLAELGDDRSRFVDARGVKAYAGAAPVTRASGKRCQVLARKVKTNGWPPSATSGRSPP